MSITRATAIGKKRFELLSGDNDMSDDKILTKEDIPYSLGLIKDPPDERDYLLKNALSHVPDIRGLPDKVDYSSEMSSVKNQGALGSCVAMATAAVKE